MRVLRSRAPAVLAGVLMVAVTGPALAAAPPASPPPSPPVSRAAAKPPEEKTFTLLTGDVVRLRTAADGSATGEVVNDVAPWATSPSSG